MKAITRQIKSSISISNMTSSSGREVPNQFIIRTSSGVMFQSYDSNIAFIPNDEEVIYLGRDWDYSVTTSKYRNQFLNCNKKELEAMIKEGRAVISREL